MNAQPVDLLAHIGLGGDQRQLLREALLREAGAGLEQQRHLLVDPLTQLFRLDRSLRRGLLGERADALR